MRAGCGVLEGDAGTQHMVQPGFQGAGDGEVVHRRGQHQDIGGQHFIGKDVGECQRGLFRLALLLCRGHPAAQQVGVQVWYLLDCQVANLDSISRVSGLPMRDELLGELAGNRTLLAGAAFDYQNLRHWICSIEGLLNVDGAKSRDALIDKKA
ncbi:hypothetical protein D9M68_694620 [compost metagenome]